MKGTTFILVRGSRIQCNIGRLRWQKLDASGHEFTTTVDSVTNAGTLTAGSWDLPALLDRNQKLGAKQVTP